ncbi:DUF2474 domain-containing protein [Erwiniaceae bacterium L1_55_4]|nr:DUF2474 domain-containing protein [Erwiniaceae bacterium L1_55_4]
MLPTQKNQHAIHRRESWWRRLLWLIVIYSASVLALGIIAALMRMLMNAAGMRSE